MIAPVRIFVYDKDFAPLGQIGTPKFVTVVPRHNAASTATIGMLADDPKIELLTADGNRVRIVDENGLQLCSGRITGIRGTGPRMEAVLEFDVIGYFDDLFNGVLGWVVPTAAITAQGTAGTNWTMTDAAETVIKTAVQLNAIDRLGLPFVCAPDLGRGGEITAKLRMDPLYELFPVIDGAGADAAGIGVTVEQGTGVNADKIVVDVHVPNPIVRTLTEQSGVVVEWRYSSKVPTVTRVVVGGQGEGTLRNWRERVATDGRETEIGWKIERFRDARDTNDPDVMYARGDETLAEGARKSGLSVKLSQTQHFRYGANGVVVGDTVAIAINGQVAVTAVLREATLSWTVDDGWKVTPKVGDVDDSPDQRLSRVIAQMSRFLARSRRV